MDKKNTEAVKEILSRSRRIVIVSHSNPDGDAVGSSLALGLFLTSLGHSCSVMMPNDLPDFLKWMPGAGDIVIYENTPEEGEKIIEKAELIFTLDFNDLTRAGALGDLLQKSRADFIMIDHHQQPMDYAVVKYSDSSMSSTSEMIFHFMKALGEESRLTKEIATNIYTGIMTDTGSFRFASTSATTHRVAARLLEAGAENAVIQQQVLNSNSLDGLKLLAVALSNINVLPEYKTAYITLSQEELNRHNFKKGDTEGFVNYGLSIKGIVFAVIFIENKQENMIKISFRSIGDFSVNEFARKHFNGGGHKNAAGGRSSLSLEETVKEFISTLSSYKKNLEDAT